MKICKGSESGEHGENIFIFKFASEGEKKRIRMGDHDILTII